MMLKQFRDHLEQALFWYIFISVYLGGTDELVQYNFPDIQSLPISYVTIKFPKTETLDHCQRGGS